MGYYSRPIWRTNDCTFLKSRISHNSQSLSEEEQRLFRLYGKLPSKKDILKNKLKVFLPPPTAPLHFTNLTGDKTKRNANTSTQATTLSQKPVKPRTSAWQISALSIHFPKTFPITLPRARPQVLAGTRDLPLKRAHSCMLRARWVRSPRLKVRMLVMLRKLRRWRRRRLLEGALHLRCPLLLIRQSLFRTRGAFWTFASPLSLFSFSLTDMWKKGS